MNWLFLRGLVRDQHRWDSFPEEFAAGVEGARVFCLDLPGIGTELARPSPQRVEAITQDLRYRWLALQRQNPGDWSVLAMSLGGMCALHWLADFAADFKVGVIINSSASNLSPFHSRFMLGQVFTGLRTLFTMDPQVREELILGMTSKVTHRHPAILEKRKSLTPMSQMEFAKTALRQVRAASSFKILTRPQVPLLILYSTQDQLVRSSCSIALANFLGATSRSHPWAGHDLFLDDAPWVIQQVNAWLIELDLKSRK